MNVVSFNVNSVRLRLHQLAALTESHAPDVIGLQETKVVDADFPLRSLYHSPQYGSLSICLLSFQGLANFGGSGIFGTEYLLSEYSKSVDCS